MGGSMKGALVVVMCMCMLSAAVMTVEGVTCNDVTTRMAPCMSYLLQGGTPTSMCCNGVRNILGAAGTTADKQTICSCLKNAANSLNLNDQYAQALPSHCNVHVPYKISRSTNCATIKF